MKNIENNDNTTHIEKVSKEKLENLLKICMIILIISFLSYLVGIFLFGVFDFGLIFEIISFVFIAIAYNKIWKSEIAFLKRNIIIAMIPIGWLIIYDFIELLANIGEVLMQVTIYYYTFDRLFFFIGPYIADVFLIAVLVLLYKSFSALKKAEESKDVNKYIGNFYDKL